MLFRFSLYGFLKNQRYFEPFLVLAFLDKGLSFFLIGLLIAFREATVNILEIPSGAMADVWGRRSAMMVSFASYIVSFAIFGAAEGAPALFLAMFFFGVGETFRTGTHKAMIFAWLRLEGRTGEKTKFYGYTRSWSKFGSAVSVVLAAVFVVVSDSYAYVFYLAIIPYVLGIVNFLGYPRALDGLNQQTLVGVAGNDGRTGVTSLNKLLSRRESEVCFRTAVAVAFVAVVFQQWLDLLFEECDPLGCEIAFGWRRLCWSGLCLRPVRS